MIVVNVTEFIDHRCINKKIHWLSKKISKIVLSLSFTQNNLRLILHCHLQHAGIKFTHSIHWKENEGQAKLEKSMFSFRRIATHSFQSQIFQSRFEITDYFQWCINRLNVYGELWSYQIRKRWKHKYWAHFMSHANKQTNTIKYPCNIICHGSGNVFINLLTSSFHPLASFMWFCSTQTHDRTVLWIHTNSNGIFMADERKRKKKPFILSWWFSWQVGSCTSLANTQLLRDLLFVICVSSELDYAWTSKRVISSQQIDLIVFFFDQKWGKFDLSVIKVCIVSIALLISSHKSHNFT